MSRFVKEKIIKQYGERFRDVSDLAVINTQGIDVIRMTAFRGALRRRGIQAMRLHNRLSRRALASGNLAGIETLLDGPSTIVWGGENIVDIAKILKSQAATLTELAICGGMSDGEVLSKERVEALSALPSREELIGWIVGNAIGQAARVTAAAMAVGGRLLAQIREIQEQTPAGETPPDEQAETDEPETRADAAEQREAPSDATKTDDAGPAEEPKPDDSTEADGAKEPQAPEQATTDQ